MSKTNNLIRAALEEVLGHSGFSRKGDSWYRRTHEIVEVVNLQRSQYSERYFANYALWLLPLGETKFPREEKCHIRMRLDAIASSREEVERLLDLEKQMPESERRAALVALFADELLPFADGCRSLDALASRLDAGQLSKGMVLATAERLLAGHLASSAGSAQRCPTISEDDK